jgi:hypothetical protein
MKLKLNLKLVGWIKLVQDRVHERTSANELMYLCISYVEGKLFTSDVTVGF